MDNRRRILEQQVRLLHQALQQARRLPGYRGSLGRLLPDLDPVDCLRRLSILQRQDLQRDTEAFRDPRCPSIGIHTSGSTGTPLVYYLAHRARVHRLVQYARFFAMHGCRPWDRSLSFKVLPDSSQRVGGAWLDRSVLIRRTVASVNDPPRHQFQVLKASDPHILHGLPSTLEQLAVQVQLDDWRPTRLRRIFTSSESLDRNVRHCLENVMGAPVVDHYGTAEGGMIGWECELRSGYHLNVHSLFVEVLDGTGNPVAPGEVGQVCLTTLDNPAMPLVRYAVGDLAVAGDGTACPCGRPEPILPEVIGRAIDLFYFHSGPKSPWAVVARMREIRFLRRFQLVQTDVDTVQVRVQSTGRGSLDHEEIRELVTSEMGGDIRVMIQDTDEFPRLPSGKFAPALRLYQPLAR